MTVVQRRRQSRLGSALRCVAAQSGDIPSSPQRQPGESTLLQQTVGLLLIFIGMSAFGWCAIDWLAVMGTIDLALRRKWPASETQALAWFVGSVAVVYVGALLAGSERRSRANADNHRRVVGHCAPVIDRAGEPQCRSGSGQEC